VKAPQFHAIPRLYELEIDAALIRPLVAPSVAVRGVCGWIAHALERVGAVRRPCLSREA
jgi:hypothetical protein